MLGLGGKAIGLDISDSSVEIIALKREGDGYGVVSSGRAPLPAGAVVRGAIKKQKEVQEAIARACSDAKPEPIKAKEVAFGLQEGVTFTQHLTISAPSRSLVGTLVFKELTKVLPIPAEHLAYTFSIVSAKDASTYEVFALAADRRVMAAWEDALSSMGFKTDLFDSQLLAAFRGTMLAPVKDSVCFLDMGAVATSVGFFDASGLRYSYVIPIAGDAITTAIATELGIDAATAEKKKITTGISSSVKEKALKGAITGVLKEICADIKETQEYLKRANGFVPARVIMTGGTSAMSGAGEYLSEQLKLPVVTAAEALKGQKTVQLPKRVTNLHLFAGALGLALRDLDKAWEDRDPGLSLTRTDSTRLVVLPKESEGVTTVDRYADVEDEEYEEQKQLATAATQIDKKSKEQKQLLMLAIILIGGALLIVSAYFLNHLIIYPIPQQSQAGSYSIPDTLRATVPVAVETSEYTPDRVRGRIVERKVADRGDHLEAIDHARSDIERSLQPGERLWTTMLSGSIPNENATYPGSMYFLVYSEPEAQKLMLASVKQQVPENVKFILDAITFDSITVSSNPQVYLLTGTVNILSSERFTPITAPAIKELEPAAQPTPAVNTPAAVVEVPRIAEITESPIGVVNIRSGAGTTFAVIRRASPGERHEIISESNGWYQLKLSETETGWVINTYVRIADETHG